MSGDGLASLEGLAGGDGADEAEPVDVGNAVAVGLKAGFVAGAKAYQPTKPIAASTSNKASTAGAFDLRVYAPPVSGGSDWLTASLPRFFCF